MSEARSTASARPGFVFDPSQVLRAAAPAAKRAASILAEAQSEADSILQQARQEAESIRLAAHRQGREEGLDQALRDWQSTLAAADEQRAEVARQLDDLTGHLETELMRLAVQIAEKIVRHEIETNSETILQIIRLAVRQVRDRANVKIWVNSRDLQKVREARGEISAWAEGLRDVEIGEEPRVEPGGVIIESPDGILDARPSTQLEEIRRRLEGADAA